MLAAFNAVVSALATLGAVVLVGTCLGILLFIVLDWFN